MTKLINADALKYEILSAGPAEPHYPNWYTAMIDRMPDAGEQFRMTNTAALDRFVQAAYKAGQEGRPLMVALNEVEDDG